MPSLFPLASVLKPFVFFLGDYFYSLPSLSTLSTSVGRTSPTRNRTSSSSTSTISNPPSHDTFSTMLSRPFFKSEPPKPEKSSTIQRNVPRRPRTPQTPPTIELIGWNPSTSTRLLTPDLAQELWSALPERWQFSHGWDLVYSLEQHGSSLSTLYNNCSKLKDTYAFYILVVGDTVGGIFGAALSDPPAPGGRYFGQRDSFLWKKVLRGKDGKEGPFKAFMTTGLNDYIAFCRHESISIGAGKDGTTGLWLNDRFDKGFSGRCDTFMNEALTEEHKGTFDVLGVEVWRIPF